MTDPLYGKDLLRWAARAAGAGTLEHCNAVGDARNPVCGDRVTMMLEIKEGKIVRLAHQTQACILAQASASILGEKLFGANRDTMETLRRDIDAMLLGGESPAEPFGDYHALLGAAAHRNRHKCVLLPIDAILSALADFERKSAARSEPSA